LIGRFFKGGPNGGAAAAMKKKIIVFVLSVLLTGIGIGMTFAYMDGYVPDAGGMDFLMFFDNPVINSFGVIALLFSATALILTIFCIKNCTGVLRTFSMILCVLCALSIALTILGAVLYFMQANESLTDSVLVRLQPFYRRLCSQF